MDLVFCIAELNEEVVDDSDFLLEFVNTTTVNTTTKVDTKIVNSTRIPEKFQCLEGRILGILQINTVAKSSEVTTTNFCLP
jgi:hypothetical protein